MIRTNRRFGKVNSGILLQGGKSPSSSFCVLKDERKKNGGVAYVERTFAVFMVRTSRLKSNDKGKGN
jgi:hypothetical protein